jgi:tricorn protease
MKTTARLPVEIRTDAPEVRPYLKNMASFLTEFDISPSGKQAVVVARGEVFTVPRKEGETRNLTNTSGARSRSAVWSPDGKKIAYLSDDSGEYEIYVVDPLGATKAVRLTSHRDGYRHTLRWSPDGTKIAFADQTLRCFYLDVNTGKITEIDKALYEDVDVSLDLKPIYDYAWSPDSRYIAYSRMDEDLVYHLYIYSLEGGVTRRVSEGIFNDLGPVFTRDGKHLLFISNRRFSPTFCDFEWEMVYKNVAGVYAITLQKEDGPLLPFQNDVEPVDTGGAAGAKVEPKKGPVKSREVTIDFDGITERIEALPLPAGNYRNLAVNDSTVFYINADSGDFNRFEFRAPGPRTLWAFSLNEREKRVVADGIDDYRLSADGSQIIYRKGKSLSIIDADTEGEKRSRDNDEDSLEQRDTEHELDLGNVAMRLDPAAEWRQMFNEAWRMERDFYYEPNMHGLDWAGIKRKYEGLLPDASCRQDIRYLIGEMIGELSTSHTYVYGGDLRRDAPAVNIGLLGVDWQVDEKVGRFRFGKIYRVPDWTQDIIPPLLRPGVAVNEGDYLIQVDHHDVASDKSIYSYFQNLAGKQVTLLVNSAPTTQGAREYVVKPLASDRTLRYLDWVEHNRKVAEEASGGRIGYLHLPDTYTGSTREFPKYFYSQTQKQGLIVDGRFNGGGLDPDIFLQRLGKKTLAYWTRRYSHDQTTPTVVTRAHLVCLTNRQAGSGGDELPWEFQKRGMGPVIGTRTWGGLVGISMWIDLVDGGGVSVPDYRIYDTEGKWVVENEGVEPDIPIDLNSAEMARGYDAQLMKGIEVLLKQITADPRPWPQHEPFPRQ